MPTAQFNALWLVTVLLFGLARPSQAEEVDASETLQPLVWYVGADTRIAEHEWHRIENQNDWVRLWLRHTGQFGTPADYNNYRRSGAPEIDFDRCMVIAITESPGIINAGIVAKQVTESDGQITFDYDRLLYQVREGTVAPGNAYGFFVLPRYDKPILLRRNVQQDRLQGGPPVWKEAKRFPSTDSVATASH